MLMPAQLELEKSGTNWHFTQSILTRRPFAHNSYSCFAFAAFCTLYQCCDISCLGVLSSVATAQLLETSAECEIDKSYNPLVRSSGALGRSITRLESGNLPGRVNAVTTTHGSRQILYISLARNIRKDDRLPL